MGFGIPEGSNFNTAKNFDNWTNSTENYNKALNGEETEEFEMFKAGNLQSYSSDLKKFSQDYINMWDSDGDGSWSKDEFIMMSTGGEGIPSDVSEDVQAQYAQLFDDLYSNLNLDDNKDSISSGEFASYLYASDMDWENYAQTGDVSSSVDGKLDYSTYQSLSSIMEGDAGFEVLQSEKADFYNYFYAEDEAAAAAEAAAAKAKPKAEPHKPLIEPVLFEEPEAPSEPVKKEVATSKSDLPEGYKINEDNIILDKNGKEIGRVDISYSDVTNDGVKDKITRYFLNAD